jgi:alpha-mannosidase
MMDIWFEQVSSALVMLEEAQVEAREEIPAYDRKPVGYLQWKRFDETEGWERITSHTPWVGFDQHWLAKAAFSLPASWVGKMVHLSVATGATDIWDTSNPQFIACVDHHLVCGLDTNHITFPVDIHDTRFHELELFCYTSAERPTVCVTLSLEQWNPDVSGLYQDLAVCLETMTNLPDGHPARAFLIRTCTKVCHMLSYRPESKETFLTSVRAARAMLQSKVFGVGVEALATVSMVGHTHIDLAWKWTLDMTKEKCIRSFATVCNLMQRYPDYLFTSSQPQEFAFLKETMPELFSSVQSLARTGRWEMEGGAWVECDCNLTSGESLVRQCLYGKRFIQDQFGQQCRIFWMPDTFGFTANLPQIIKKSGLSYFMTTKLNWNETNMMPHDTFFWKGLDGTRVLSHMVTTTDLSAWKQRRQFNTTYNGLCNPSQVLGTWERYQDKTINNDVLSLFGYGDGGGGPTAEMLEREQRMQTGVPGLPRVRMCTARTYFEELAHRLEGETVPEWTGELYLEYHRGTYTTVARIKQENRRSEVEMMQTELLSCMATILTGHPYPKERLEQVWTLIMRNQFHDILPGSAIAEVYAHCWKEYAVIHQQNQAMQQEAFQAIGETFPWGTDTLLVYNGTGFVRSGLVKCQLAKGEVVADDAGPIPCQTYQGALYFWAEHVPSKGFRRYHIVSGHPEGMTTLMGDSVVLENPQLRAVITHRGEISELWDKEEKRSVLAGEGNVLTLSADRPREYDAWNIGKQTDVVYPVDSASSCTLETGPLFSVVKVSCRFGTSVIDQEIVLAHQGKRLDFHTTVTWNERHLMLCASFLLAVHADFATFDVAFGNVRRSTTKNTSWDEARTEVPAHKWADVSEEGYGVALLNDSKYGYCVEGNTLRLSLLRSATFPDPNADQGVHQFCYSLYPHQGTAHTSHLLEEGYFLQLPLGVVRGRGDVTTVPDSYSLLQGSERNVVIKTIKQAEDGSGTIVRLIEEGGKECQEVLTFSPEWSKAWSCSLDEKKESFLDVHSGVVTIPMKPFEIRTILFETCIAGQKRTHLSV